jgi:hypothetical protein
VQHFGDKENEKLETENNYYQKLQMPCNNNFPLIFVRVK